jgi:UDP-N-acetyl-D-glucosamine dehydrogenase
MPSWVVSKVADTLNNLGKSISKSKILVLGVAYKKNVGDLRESPAIEIIETLIKKGANIEYSDPFVTDLKAIKNSNFNTNSIDLTEQSIANKDVVIITTDHDQFDLEFVQQNALKIIDTRGAYKESFSNVIRA